MAIDPISLDNGVRDTLTPLKRLNNQFKISSERVTTGKRVNNIQDNPTNFFIAQNLLDRAGGFNARLDGMSNAVQTINAAGTGLDSMNSLLSSAQAVAESALSQSDPEMRRALGDQYNTFVEQAFSIAKDAGFNGSNLLNDNRQLSVEFGADNGESVLRVDGIRLNQTDGNGPTVTETFTQASAASQGTVQQVTSQTSVASFASRASAGTTASLASVASAAFNPGMPSVASQAAVPGQASQGTVAGIGSSASAASRPSIASQASAGTIASGGSQASIASRSSVASSGTVASVSVSYEQRFAFTLEAEGQVSGLRKHLRDVPAQAGEFRVDFGSNNFRNTLGNIAREVQDFRTSLRTQQSRFSTSASVIQVRETFTEQLTNTLQQGADNLVLADLNKETAGLAAIRTRTALGTNALALAGRQSQQVLQLLLR